MIKLGLHERVPGTLPPVKQLPFELGSANVNRGYRPGRGLLYSIVVHEIIFSSAIFLSSYGLLEPPPRPKQRVIMVNLKDPVDVFYLPAIGSRSPAPPAAADASESEPAKPAELSA